jgi:hypothetical protein
MFLMAHSHTAAENLYTRGKSRSAGAGLRLARIIGGFAMLFVGVLGLVLPVMPGWIFVIPGLALLGREFHWARRLLEWIKKYHPKNFRSKTSPEA